MSTTFGSRRLVVGAHYGLRDWLAQRATSIVIAIFTVAVVVQVLMPGTLDYYKWSAIFSRQWMKVLTFVTVVALVYHVWVGMRDIWMDYAKPASLRLALEIATIAWLVGCAGWAVQVIWRL
ncbi:MAG: succinate dehydrogenase, hydrophobic membrane anchor protein [Caldimonas sp.]